MRAAFISHSDCGRHDTGWDHPEHVGRLRGITRALRDDPELFHTIDHLEGRHATIEELTLAHDPDYIRSIKESAEQGGRRLYAETVASTGSWDATTARAGCVLSSLSPSFACILPRNLPPR